MAEEGEKKYKIIITDDDDFLVDMYVAKFNSNDATVEVCKSGDALIDKLKTETRVDLILLDIIMPNFSGLDTLKKIREEKLGEGIPIVMLTNQSDEKDISEAKNLGVAGYIVKSAATPSEVVSESLNIIKNSKGS